MKCKFTAMTNVSPAPPQPPPSKKSRKTLIAAIVIVIIVVAAIVGAYLIMRSGSNAPSNNNPTPSPGTTTSPGSATPSPIQTNPIEGATSMQYSVSYTAANQSFGYTYYAKNIGTSNMLMRIEYVIDNESMSYIINGAQQKIWINSGGIWTGLDSQVYESTWGALNQTWAGFQTSLGDWAGVGEYTYGDPVSGYSYRIYNIVVNPELADSLFQPPI